VARGILVSLALLLLRLPTAAATPEFGPGEAASGARAVRRPAPRGDFLVLVWYHRNDPLGTFKYEVYDLRREQNIAKIDSWITDTRTKYPAYVISVNDVDLTRERGATESLKVGSVIQRELAVAAGLAGIVVGQRFDLRPQPALATPSPGTSVSPLSPLNGGPSFPDARGRAAYSNSPSPAYLPSLRRPP
jgi:hypothetical protein